MATHLRAMMALIYGTVQSSRIPGSNMSLKSRKLNMNVEADNYRSVKSALLHGNPLFTRTFSSNVWATMEAIGRLVR